LDLFVSKNVSVFKKKFGSSIVVDLIVVGTDPSTSHVTSPIILSFENCFICSFVKIFGELGSQ
jgi:hypothetical protein